MVQLTTEQIIKLRIENHTIMEEIQEFFFIYTTMKNIILTINLYFAACTFMTKVFRFTLYSGKCFMIHPYQKFRAPLRDNCTKKTRSIQKEMLYMLLHLFLNISFYVGNIY